MADFEKMVPFIIYWETGTKQRTNESVSSLFERSRKKGYANDPSDSGGATQTGVTLSTYRAYCKNHNLPKPGVNELQTIPYEHWRAILKNMYWDRWKGDKINNQSIAQICVDWVWASGKYGITGVQKVLGITADGIVGPKTLGAVNAKPQMNLFYSIRRARIQYVENLAQKRPKDKKYLRGWKNRIYDINYTEQ